MDVVRKRIASCKEEGGYGGDHYWVGSRDFLFDRNKIPQASNVLKEALKSCFKRKPIQRVFKSFLSSKIDVKKGSITYFWTTCCISLSQDTFRQDKSSVLVCIRDLWK